MTSMTPELDGTDEPTIESVFHLDPADCSHECTMDWAVDGGIQRECLTCPASVLIEE